MYPGELALDKDDGAVAQRSAVKQIDSAVDLGFNELFERYSPMVFRLAYHILGDREEALDISQEVFLTLYRKLHTFRGESSLKTWIYCIAANRASNHCRWWSRLRRRGTISLEEHLSKKPGQDHSPEMKSSVPTPEDELLAQEERRKVERMLLQLPLHQRIAVIMRDIEGLSYKEIAAAMEVSPGTVKSRIARGRETLKRHLGGRQ